MTIPHHNVFNYSDGFVQVPKRVSTFLEETSPSLFNNIKENIILAYNKTYDYIKKYSDKLYSWLYENGWDKLFESNEFKEISSKFIDFIKFNSFWIYLLIIFLVISMMINEKNRKKILNYIIAGFILSKLFSLIRSLLIALGVKNYYFLMLFNTVFIILYIYQKSESILSINGVITAILDILLLIPFQIILLRFLGLSEYININEFNSLSDINLEVISSEFEHSVFHSIIFSFFIYLFKSVISEKKDFEQYSVGSSISRYFKVIPMLLYIVLMLNLYVFDSFVISAVVAGVMIMILSIYEEKYLASRKYHASDTISIYLSDYETEHLSNNDLIIKQEKISMAQNFDQTICPTFSTERKMDEIINIPIAYVLY